jgi:hypothetical protein
MLGRRQDEWVRGALRGRDLATRYSRKWAPALTGMSWIKTAPHCRGSM